MQREKDGHSWNYNNQKRKKGENAKEKKHCMMTERRKQTWAMVGKNERNTSNREQSNQ